MRRKVWLLLILAVLPVWAQTYNAVREGSVIAELWKAKWRFHTGDDPRWAAPDADDSHWSLLGANKPWDEQGYPHYSGFGWYRIHLVMPVSGKAMRFQAWFIHDSFQVFADGHNIGGFGPMSPDQTPTFSRVPELLSAEFVPRSREVVIAIRVLHWSKWAAWVPGGFTNGLLAGPSNAVAELGVLHQKEWMFYIALQVFLGLVALIAACFSLLIYRRHGSGPEYLWLAINLLSGPVFGEFFPLIPSLLVDMKLNVTAMAGATAGIVSGISGILFVARLVGKAPGRFSGFYLIAQAPIFVLQFLLSYNNAWVMPEWNILESVNNSIAGAIVLYLIFSSIRTSRAARMLALPMTMFFGSGIVYSVVSWLRTAGLATLSVPRLIDQPVSFDYMDLSAAVFLVCMAWFLIDRFADSRSEETRFKTEFESAQQVQQLLLQSPAQSVDLPVEVCYLPANETGGDFFKILHESGGSLLIAVGDVSGKGLKAAMMVAGIIGALELIPTETISPAAVLVRLNEFLLNKNRDGFVTCCCARILPDGTLTIANAGHLPPYLDGDELPVTASLPLGIAAGMEFSETRHQMNAGARLVFVTDGVVEAANKSGELFGFERTRAASANAPQSIAHQAQDFGQNDDITVLLVTRMAAYAA